MKSLIVLGDLIADLCLGVQRFPIEPDQHQDVSMLMLGPGGAGNVLVSAARLGVRGVALGAVGDDWIGQHLWSQLRAEGVDTHWVVRMTNETTPTAVILRAEDRQRVFMGFAGTRGPASVPAEWRDKFREAGLLFLDGWAYRHGYPVVLRACVDEAAARGVRVLFDPGPHGIHIEPEWLQAILAKTEVALVTEAEAQALTRANDTRASLSVLHEWGARVVALKLGERGCLIDTGTEQWECPAYPVVARDTTAAGDCFSAAVVWGLLHEKPWDVIGALANAVGAAKVQKIGSGLAAPTRAEVEAVLRVYRPDLLIHFE